MGNSLRKQPKVDSKIQHGEHKGHSCFIECFTPKKMKDYRCTLETVDYGWLFTSKHEKELRSVLSIYSLDTLFPLFKSYLIPIAYANSSNLYGFPFVKASYHTFIRKQLFEKDVICEKWKSTNRDRLRIVMLGEGGVGKTSLVTHAVSGTLDPS